MAAPQDTPFACSCGKLGGVLLAVDPNQGTHAECHCTSCRCGEIYCGQPDPAPDPVGIFQTSADKVRIDRGQEHLAVFSFGETNLLRWYADCCGSPMFNTLRNPKLGFAGVRTSCLADTAPLGPIVATGFIPTENGKQKHRGLPVMVWRTLRRMTGDRLSGRWKNGPFFDSTTLQPIRPVKIVSAEERRGLIKST